MEKANIAVKYDVKYDILCDVDHFRKNLELLSDLGFDIVSWHNEGGTCLELDKMELMRYIAVHAPEDNPDLFKFVKCMLDISCPDLDDVRIEIY